MLDNIIISKYYNSNSDIHTLNSLSKLISLIIFITCLIITNNYYIISILFVFELIILLITNIPLKIIIKNILSLKYLIIFVIIINTIAKINLITTLIIIIKLICILIYTNLFILTTTPYSILKALNKLLKPLSYIGINTQNIALIISLSLRFIPVTIEETSRIYDCLVSRGLSSDSSFKEKICGLKSLIIPIYLLSFRRADILSDMMELKLYNSKSKFFAKKDNWKYLDISFVIMHVIIILVVLKEVILWDI